MSLITRITASFARRREARRRAEITARFTLTERSGQIFICCDGIAVDLLCAADTVADITSRLDAHRQAAITHNIL